MPYNVHRITVVCESNDAYLDAMVGCRVAAQDFDCRTFGSVAYRDACTAMSRIAMRVPRCHVLHTATAAS